MEKGKEAYYRRESTICVACTILRKRGQGHLLQTFKRCSLCFPWLAHVGLAGLHPAKEGTEELFTVAGYLQFLLSLIQHFRLVLLLLP